jgi:hypothetical protein
MCALRTVLSARLSKAQWSGAATEANPHFFRVLGSRRPPPPSAPTAVPCAPGGPP